ncbi:nucleoside hydrolase-like domain-containing protein [Kriegella aquimaris]|uniref:DUF1593 domain-containing protein n=1 Tax=Kriegella aquimaris TaxID=192904 RepID=A0A1G9J6U4_9FLAO|nr:nucleoside hydrolase-like domain-containing protein [Kriegella aquimaris]SDL32923.1 Protein of unknown function [Kriegella aquimaris]
MRTLFTVLLFLFLTFEGIAQKDKRPRLLVLTDIGGDPDDEQSIRHLLVYSNEFRIEGLIATSDNIPRKGYKHRIRTDLLVKAIKDYGEVRENLLLHNLNYPTAESLLKVVHGGQVNRGVENLKIGKETSGSKHIIKTVDASKELLYITIWGGAHDLAQALLDIKSTRSPRKVETFVKKLRVFAISDQDGWNSLSKMGTGQWIRQNFPEIWYVEPGPLSMNSLDASFRGMYQNDSRGSKETLPLVAAGIENLNSDKWIKENINNWGPLGKGYPNDVHQNPPTTRNLLGVKEGDTPSWFFVYQNGLNNPKFPEWGGWGGRYAAAGESYYIDAEDNHWSGEMDKGLRQKWTIARWREAYQNDFAARMTWNLLPYEKTNHNPVVIVDNDRSRRIIKLNVKPGQTINIDASRTYDPDGDKISFKWWEYSEVSVSPVSLSSTNEAVVRVELPEQCPEGDIHLILEVKDDGSPELVSYRRIILQVK